MDIKKIEFFRKPKKCPVCGSANIAVYIWGEITDIFKLIDEMKGKPFYQGGCGFPINGPKWKCLDCETDIFKKQ